MTITQADLVVPLTLPILPGSLEPVPGRSGEWRPTPPFRVLETAASSRSLARTAIVASEACGRYATWETDPEMPRDEYVTKPQTHDIPTLYHYLRPARNTDAGSLALDALSYAVSGAASPMQAWLALAASLSPTLGGAGLPRPDVAAVCQHPDDTVLPAEGRYLAYDLLWRDATHCVALQWVGPEPVPVRDLGQLSCGTVSVVTLDEIDADSVRKAMEMVGELIGVPVSPVSDELLALAPTMYPRQTTSVDDLASHVPTRPMRESRVARQSPNRFA